MVRAAAFILISLTAHADATFSLDAPEKWQAMGNGHGPVHLMVGEARLDAVPGKSVSMTVPAGGPELVPVLVSIGSRPLRPRFFLDIEDGHHYRVAPDPCCFLQITDDDDRFIALARCGPCPKGMVGVNQWAYRKAGCKLTCAPPAWLRVEAGSAELSFDGGDPRRFSHDYQQLSLGRDSPVELTIKGRTIWALFRRASRYTLIIGPTLHIVRDLE